MGFAIRLRKGAYKLIQENYYKLLVDYIGWRIKKKKNCLIVTCGGTGSGKSIADLFLAEKIQKKTLPHIPFTADNIVFKGSEFCRAVTGKTAKPSGSVIIMEETGVSMNSRRSMSNINILLSDIFQTFRSKQYVVLLNVPDFHYIDKSVRKLLHVYMNTKGIDFKKKRNCLSCQIMQNNSKLGKIYYHSLKAVTPDQPTMKIPHIYTYLPDQKLWDEYEVKKKIYQDELYEKNLRMMEAEESLGELTERQELVYDMNQKGLTQKKIAEAMGIEQAAVHKHIDLIRKKGYKVKRHYASPVKKEDYNP